MVSRLRSCCAMALVLAGGSGPALAQSRSDENAVTQAEDAFGFSVGRESLGIYNAGNARGFSPSAAGNLRIDGLYFDPAYGLQGTLVDSTSIKVGLSAQGYPFAAPSGIVDQTLRRPGDKAGASMVANFDSFGTAGVEVDGSLPLGRRSASATDSTAPMSNSPTAPAIGTIPKASSRFGVPRRASRSCPSGRSSTIMMMRPAHFTFRRDNSCPKLARQRHNEGPDWGDYRYTGMNTASWHRRAWRRIGWSGSAPSARSTTSRPASPIFLPTSSQTGAAIASCSRIRRPSRCRTAAS